MIVFMGFKHVGKTFLGRATAAAMALPFVDLDEWIEENQGLSVRSILENHGAEHFKQLEQEALKKLLQNQGILALGGSTPLNPEVQDLLQGHVCVHITADMEDLVERIEANGRPASFPQGDLREVIASLSQARHPVYAALATHTVHNHRDAPRLLEDIQNLLK